MMSPAWAQLPDDAVEQLSSEVHQLTGAVKQLTGTVESQQRRIEELERANAQLRATAAPPQPLAAEGSPVVPVTTSEPGVRFIGALGGPPRVPSVASSLSAFNPEIGVLADVVGTFSESELDTEGNDRLSAREVELVIGHPIDPYSRLDMTVAFSDFEETSLEEAYITHWGLPGEINARIGRFRPKIGKAGALHRDSLETVDEPLVVAQYLGAEGLSRTGVDMTAFLPAPWIAVTHEVTAGVLEGGVGEGGTLFGATRRRPTVYSHLKNFWDVTDTTNGELGLTYMVGSKDDDDRFESHALGVDATLVHHVTPNNKLKWQNELYVNHREDQLQIADDGTETELSEHPWGAYSLLDYRLSPRLGVGGRFDYVEPIDVDPLATVRDGDIALGGYLTFYQSEFARWRLQYRHTEFAQGGDDNAVFLQGTVAIGVHKHQIQ
jgi:hypothetical protein